MLRKLCVLSSLFFAIALAAVAQDSRHFTFHYAFTVKNLASEQRAFVSGFLRRTLTPFRK